MESNVSWVTFDTRMRTGFPDPVTLLICKTFLSWIRAFMQGVHVHEVCTNVCQVVCIMQVLELKLAALLACVYCANDLLLTRM